MMAVANSMDVFVSDTYPREGNIRVGNGEKT